MRSIDDLKRWDSYGFIMTPVQDNKQPETVNKKWYYTWTIRELMAAKRLGVFHDPSNVFTIDFDDDEYNFKGFIDLVLKTSDGKYHIIDWKTCSWGWDSRKKSDPMVTYQLTFYKHFYAKKHGIDPKNVETYFALLKRTAKQNNVEIFRVTSGPRKTNNALNFLNRALYNIQKDNHIKNRLSCKNCDFYKTEHCT